MLPLPPLQSPPAGIIQEAFAAYQHQSLRHQEDCGSEYAGRGFAHGQLLPAEDRPLRWATIPFLHPTHRPAVAVHHTASHSGAAASYHWQVKYLRLEL